MTEGSSSTYIVAEIGQNHNGDMNIAKQLIDMASMPIFDKFNNRQLSRINGVKLTKRDLSEEFSIEERDRPYDSPHSFGKTYGEHRECLELSYEQHAELGIYARSKGLDFVETLTSIKTVSLLKYVDIDLIKVASRDLTNLPLLEELSKLDRKMILSTGMATDQEIDTALNVITRYHEKIALLHCVSEYPAQYEHLNLFAIRYLMEKYPFEIGLSDHSIGIVMAPVAVALGATIIEKHITLSRNMKGSDHRASLEPDGLWRMARDIRNVEFALGKKSKIVPEAVQAFKLKLERSIAAKRDVRGGEILTEDDLCMLSPGHGLRWAERNKIIGKKVKRLIPKHTIILMEELKDENAN